MSEAKSGHFSDKPVTNEDYQFESWNVNYKSSHILPSKCLATCSSSLPCIYCHFEEQLGLSHLPEMVYPNNVLKLTHVTGCEIEFNALDALRAVKNNERPSVTIACADEWKNARKESGLVENTIGKFDWTFSSDYCGSLKNYGSNIAETSEGIDINRLKQKEEILLYKNVTLFEDELHDNGISLCSVRIRVMPSSFFVLLRHFLRVDGVIISVHDARYFHDFKTDFIIRETSFREGRVSELKLPINVMNEPDEVTPLLPLVLLKKEKIILVNNC